MNTKLLIAPIKADIYITDCSTAWTSPAGWTVMVDPVVYYNFDSLCDIKRKHDVNNVTVNQAGALVSGYVSLILVSVLDVTSKIFTFIMEELS